MNPTDQDTIDAVQNATYVAMEIQMQLADFAATPKGRASVPPINLQMPTVHNDQGGVVQWRFFCAEAGRLLHEEYEGRVAASSDFNDGMWPTLTVEFAATVVDKIVTERTLISEEGLRELAKAAINEQVEAEEKSSQASQPEILREEREKCALVFADELPEFFPGVKFDLEPAWDGRKDQPAYELILPIENDGTISQYRHGRNQRDVSQWHALETPLTREQVAGMVGILVAKRIAPMSQETQTNRARDRAQAAGPENPYALPGDEPGADKLAL